MQISIGGSTVCRAGWHAGSPAMPCIAALLCLGVRLAGDEVSAVHTSMSALTARNCFCLFASVLCGVLIKHASVQAYEPYTLPVQVQGQRHGVCVRGQR